MCDPHHAARALDARRQSPPVLHVLLLFCLRAPAPCAVCACRCACQYPHVISACFGKETPKRASPPAHQPAALKVVARCDVWSRYRVCVTAAKLDQPGGCIRARVPLLVPSPPRAYASADKPKRGGKRNPRGAMDEEGDAGKGAGAAHRTQDVVFDEGAFELSFPPGVVPMPALSSPSRCLPSRRLQNSKP